MENDKEFPPDWVWGVSEKLGISVEEIEAKIKELEAQGITKEKAFDLLFIEKAERKLNGLN